MVLEWVDLRRDELLVAWDLVQKGASPGKVPPLE